MKTHCPTCGTRIRPTAQQHIQKCAGMGERERAFYRRFRRWPISEADLKAFGQGPKSGAHYGR